MRSDRHGLTDRLELADPTLRQWEAVVLATDERGIVLDRSAFYPGGGGQPPDHGVVSWDGHRARIVDVQVDDEIRLIAAGGDELPAAGTHVHAELDDARRTALMRTHTAVHVLAAVIFREYGAQVTGGSMEPLEARTDFNLTELPADFRAVLEEGCNREIAADRPISARVVSRDEALQIPDVIRTATNLLPSDLGDVRIVTIEGLDTQADGGTHVASTAGIGRIEVVKVDNKGRGFRRVRMRVTE